MPLESILEKIEEEAKKKCEDILTQAEDKKTAIIADAKEKALALEKEIVEGAQRESLPLKSRAMSRAESMKRQMILSAKREMVKEVMDQALSMLKNMDEKSYKDMLIHMIVASSEGQEEVLMGKDDQDGLGLDFEDALNDRLRQLGKRPSISVRFQDRPLGGGFILRKGGIRWNYTFPAIVDLLRDELEMEVANILFSGHQGAGD